MQHDRARPEEGEIGFFIGRNLPERMKRSMRGFLQRRERNQTNLVRLAHFLERPANAHVTRKSLAAIGRPFKGGDGGGHGQSLAPREPDHANHPRDIAGAGYSQNATLARGRQVGTGVGVD